MAYPMIKGKIHLSVRLLALAAEAEGFGGFKYEYRFAPPRRFRFDLAWPHLLVAFERDGFGAGGSAGRHQRITGFESDIEKLNLAQNMGWVVIRGTPGMIRRGSAMSDLLVALRYRKRRGKKRPD